MKNRKYLKVIILTIFVFSLLFVVLSISKSAPLTIDETKSVPLPDIPLGEVLMLSDLGDEEKSVSSYYSDVDALERLKKFYIALSTNSNWQYNEVIDQPTYINLDEFKGNETHRTKHGDEVSKIIKARFNGVIKEYVEVNAMLLNANAVKMSNFSLVEGQLFGAESYIIDDASQQTVPVLLGNSYKGIYEIGDKIVGAHISCELTYQVIGILQPNCGVYRHGRFYSLDNYLVLPALNFTNSPRNKDELVLQGATYLQKVNGEVLLNADCSKEMFWQVFQEMIDEYDMFGYNYGEVIYDDVGKDK